MSSWAEVGIHVKNLKEGNQVMKCPECSHTRTGANRNHPCLTVHQEEGNRWWKCNHCGWGGSLENFEQQQQLKEAYNYPKQKPKMFSKATQEFLQSKCIDQKTALALGWYEFKSSKGNQVLGFPQMIGQTIVNIKLRKIGDGPRMMWQSKREYGTRSIFMGFNQIEIDRTASNEVIITEGETDQATWYQSGYTNVLSVPMGAPSENAKNFDKEFQYLEDPYFKTEIDRYIEKYIIAVDDDKGGRLLRDELCRRLGKTRCWTVTYPKGYKDVNEIYAGDSEKDLSASGKKGVDSLYRSQTPIPIKGLVKAKQIKDRLEYRREHGYQPGYFSEYKEVNKYLSIKAPYLYVVAAPPGAGKSVFVRTVLQSVIKANPEERIKIAVNTPEQRPIDREISKTIECVSDGIVKKGEAESLTDQQFDKWSDWVDDHYTFIEPDPDEFEELNLSREQGENSLDVHFTYIKQLVRTEGIKGYIIDPWNKIDHQVPKFDTMSNYIGRCLDRIINFNKLYDLFCIIVAHPTKVGYDKSGLNYRQIGLYDISETSHWNNKVDVGIILKRDLYEKNDEGEWTMNPNIPTVATVAKVKFEEIASLGSFPMWFDNKTEARYRFTEPESEQTEIDVQPLYEPKEEEGEGDWLKDDTPF